MTAFCTSCGSPLAEGQAFCTKCGARIGSPQAASAAPPPSAPAAPVQAGGGSAFVKIVLIVVGVIFVFGAIGIAGVVYVGYRAKQKLREMGLTSIHENGGRASTLRGVDGCLWLSKEDVSAAIGMPVVRAEPEGTDTAGCKYNVMGDVTDLTVKHAMQLNKKQMTKSDQESMEKFSKMLTQGNGALGGSDTSGEHPGEVPVLGFSVNQGAAQFQIKLQRGVLGGLGPNAATNVADLGDEAFDAAGAVLFVRKGDKLLQITYTQCPCGLDEILPLARKLVAAM